MISSYALSQNYNLQTVLWAIAGGVATAYRALAGALPALIALLAITWPALPCGLAIVAAFGWATYPQAKGAR